MTRVLFISLAAGAGHVQAAVALQKTAAKFFPNLTTAHLEMSEYLPALYRAGLVDSYHSITKKSPRFWSYLYSVSNTERFTRWAAAAISPAKFMGAGDFYRAVEEFAPDHIICTNSVPAYFLASPPPDVHITAPVSVVVTDYSLHWYWVQPNVQYYFVATEAIRRQLMRETSLNPAQIIVSGIPVEPVWYEAADRTLLAAKHGLNLDRPIVLALSGGHGLIDLSVVITQLEKIKQPLTVLAVAGKNEALREKLLALPKGRHDLRVLGWTNDMPDLTRVADVVISKSGGLTTTECMIAGRPLVAVFPIPGQEEANARFIIANNLGLMVKKDSAIAGTVERLLHSPLHPKSIKPAVPAGQTILKTILS